MRKREVKKMKQEAEERFGKKEVDLLEQMKSKLLKDEADTIERQKQAKTKAAIEREKNKTFEELLSESEMDWHKYK
ncbi:MAG: YqkE family protein [Bacillota bacterium]